MFNLSLLLWIELLQQLWRERPQFQESASRLNTRTFPDGSLYVADRTDVLQMYELLAGVRGRENTRPRALACFRLACN